MCMKKAKNILAITLLLSGSLVASEGGSLPVQSTEDTEVTQVAEITAPLAGTELDEQAQGASHQVAGTIGAVLRNSSHPLPSSILRAVDRDRVAHGLPAIENLTVVRPTREQIAAAAQHQDQKERRRERQFPVTSYLHMGGYKK